MNFVNSIAVATLFVAAVATTNTFAQSGSEGVFTIHNDTDGNVLVGFYTNDGSGWSANWLSDPLDPGQEASAEFTSEAGSCEQTFQAGWLGQDNSEVMDEPVDIDICEASHVYLGDNEISFD